MRQFLTRIAKAAVFAGIGAGVGVAVDPLMKAIGIYAWSVPSWSFPALFAFIGIQIAVFGLFRTLEIVNEAPPELDERQQRPLPTPDARSQKY